ncbi:ATP-binding protein [Umezawaea endophytica]|uniref:ATP-binding protein n=1 Tax=Umezawaea endophytica TaxID=1654476 RepID=UPI0035EDBEFD
MAFVTVTVLGAAAAAWSSAGSASTALVESSQRRLAEAVTNQVATIAPGLTFPPTQDALELLRSAVGPNALVTRGDLRAAEGLDLFTDSLRDAVRTRSRLVSQRAVAEGRPWLLIGTPVMITAVDGTRTASGIEVYVARDLSAVDDEIDGMARTAGLTAALALPFAVLLAWLAASSVLRPVRNLRDTARRLAVGDLEARSRPEGSDELADLTVTINEMAGSVQTSMAAMRRMQADARRFAADVSHELRTPLSTLTAVVEVLAMTADRMEPDARESAQLAITETQRLVTLVEDLMEVSRFDAGTAELRVEDVDVTTAVRQCLRARSWLDEVELTAPAGLFARLDRRRLDVVVANLAGNALRHGAPPVRVTVSATADTVRIEVCDNGPGIPAHVLPHVFDRFYKADTARARTPGSGLGLAIAQENARLHGGDLTVSNLRSGGARFVLTLPRDAGER